MSFRAIQRILGLLLMVFSLTMLPTLGISSTWICALAMLLGRLEIFTLLVLFTPTFWRK